MVIIHRLLVLHFSSMTNTGHVKSKAGICFFVYQWNEKVELKKDKEVSWCLSVCPIHRSVCCPNAFAVVHLWLIWCSVDQ